MKKISIFALDYGDDDISYRAYLDNKCASGATSGAALDALLAKVGEMPGTYVIVINRHTVELTFSSVERDRLEELKAERLNVREAGLPFPADKRFEIDVLLDRQLLNSIRGNKIS